MPDDRVRRVPHARAAEPRAVRKVDVLVDHEEPLVEAAERVEQIVADEKRAAAGAEHLARRGEPASARPVSVLERTARAEVAVARAVDD